VTRRKSRSPAARPSKAPAKPRAARPAQSVLPRIALPPIRADLVGVGLVVLGVITVVAFMSRGGRLTELGLGALTGAFGWGAAILPFVIGGIGAWLMLRADEGSPRQRRTRPLGALLCFLAALGLVHALVAAGRATDGLLVSAIAREMAEAHEGGGWVGYAITLGLVPNLGVVPSAAILIVAAAVAASFAAGLGVNESAALLARSTRESMVALRARLAAMDAATSGRRALRGGTPADPNSPGLAPAGAWDSGSAAATTAAAGLSGAASGNTAAGNGADGSAAGTAGAATAGAAAVAAGSDEGAAGGAASGSPRTDWQLPAVDQMLDPSVEVQRSPDEAEGMARMIESTLAEFGIPVQVVKISTGPTITQFGLKPGYVDRGGQRTRVTVRRIVALQNDLALALSASPIRILAPVPGRPYVGVEVPNIAKAVVSLRGVMENEVFRKIAGGGGLPLALGRDTSGNPVAGDLTRMPHLLVAGATGAGKSVCINALICSLLLTHTPDRLKLVLVDPKRVEMTQYRGLPHLATPVVVEVERIVGVLQWAVREMDRRYRLFAEAGARNLENFNKQRVERGEPVLPFLVIIIDELADLMMQAPEDTERLITRLAQLARATGIHLILATQRPSVDVVTGLIKANFPSRIAFAVSSSIDSRVILDTVGADKLLGRGDMLYMASDDSKLHRLQGCYVSDDEIDRLTRYWKYTGLSGKPQADGAAAGRAGASGGDASFDSPEALIQVELWDQMMDPQSGAMADARDPLWDEAVVLIRESNAASTSFLQRKLRIGYARAGRLMDQLEAAGLIGPAQGNAPREVLVDTDADVAATEDFKTRLDRVFGAAGAGAADAGPGDAAAVPRGDLDGFPDPGEDAGLAAEDEKPPIRPWIEER
jgi:S-DNA-T family DNA segregation ATPase FtsK/SpoIIIE